MTRAEGVSEKCRAFMQRYSRPKIVDQTVLNCVCRGRTAGLPVEWGIFSVWHGKVDLRKDVCIHYVNDLPWRRDKLNRLVSDVVLLWYEFTERILGLNLRKRYMPRFSWRWRRTVFLILKHNQWILRTSAYLKSRFRNTHGISAAEYSALIRRYG